MSRLISILYITSYNKLQELELELGAALQNAISISICNLGCGNEGTWDRRYR